MNTLFTWLFILSFIGLVVGLIKPTVFAFALKQGASRKKTSLIFGVSAILFFVLVAVTDSTDITKEIADFDSPQAVTVNIAETDDLSQLKAGLLVQATLAYMTTSFVDARISTDALLQTDFNKKSFEEWNAEYAEVMKKWAKADESIKVYSETLSTIGDKTLSLIFSPKSTLIDRFIQTAYAQLTRDEVLAIYDAAPNGAKLRAVANALGVDARTANDILQDVHQDMAKEFKSAADYNDRMSKGLEAIAAGSKVFVTVAGISTAGPAIALAGWSARSAFAVANMGMIAVGGADVAIEVAGTVVSIGMSDGDTKDRIAYVLNDAREGYLGTANMVISIIDLTKAAAMLAKLENIPKLAWTSEKYAAKYGAKALEELKGGLSGNLLSFDGLALDNKDNEKPTNNKMAIEIDPNKKTATVAPLNPDVESKITIKPVDAGIVQKVADSFGRVSSLFTGFAEKAISMAKQLQAEITAIEAEETPPVQKPPAETKPPAESSGSASQCYGACQNTQVNCIRGGGSSESCGEGMRSCQNVCIMGGNQPSEPTPAPTPAPAPLSAEEQCNATPGMSWYWPSGGSGVCCPAEGDSECKWGGQ